MEVKSDVKKTKTLTDFFMSPPKAENTAIPKNLLGYFSVSQRQSSTPLKISSTVSTEDDDGNNTNELNEGELHENQYLSSKKRKKFKGDADQNLLIKDDNDSSSKKRKVEKKYEFEAVKMEIKQGVHETKTGNISVDTRNENDNHCGENSVDNDLFVETAESDDENTTKKQSPVKRIKEVSYLDFLNSCTSSDTGKQHHNSHIQDSEYVDSDESIKEIAHTGNLANGEPVDDSFHDNRDNLEDPETESILVKDPLDEIYEPYASQIIDHSEKIGIHRYFNSSPVVSDKLSQQTTVVVEVHTPSPVQIKDTRSNFIKDKAQSNVALACNNDIVVLGTCPISPLKSPRRRTHSRRRLEIVHLDCKNVPERSTRTQKTSLIKPLNDELDKNLKNNSFNESDQFESHSAESKTVMSHKHALKLQKRSCDEKTLVPAKKSTQMTFSFSKGGFKMEKMCPAEIEKNNNDAEGDNDPEEEVSHKGDISPAIDKFLEKGRCKLKSKPCHKLASDNLKSIAEEKDSGKIANIQSNDSKSTSPHSPPRTPKLQGRRASSLKQKRRILRSTYATTVVKDDLNSPVRLRITRTGCKSYKKLSAQLEYDGRNNYSKAQKKVVNNVAVAKQLLERAKGKGTKTTKRTVNIMEKSLERNKKIKDKKTDHADAVVIGATNNPRRSSRACAHVASKAINKMHHPKNPANRSKESKKSTNLKVHHTNINCDDSVLVVETSEKKLPAKIKSKTTKKSAGKLAPIFQSKKDKKPEDEVVVIKEETDEEKTSRLARQKFLQSGIPDHLRQKNCPQPKMSISDYPPIPNKEQSHVQQFSKDSVSLAAGALSLPLKNLTETKVILTKGVLQLALLTENMRKNKIRRVDSCKEKENWSTQVEQALLYEIKSNNPAFPVRKIYRSLLARKQEAEKMDTFKDETHSTTTNLKNSQHENEVKQKPGRKRGRRMASVEEIIVVDGKKMADDCTDEKKSKGSAGKDMLWTEKYQPQSSLDILGNSNSVKKLKTWLTEWKERVDREAKKLRLQMKKEAKQNKVEGEESNSSWWSDDSDFDLASDSDNDDYIADDGAINTMLLVGPHGIGKTSTAYSLAEELGYKVFEVNASSRRNGKHILAQLQEATQSHHLSNKKLEESKTKINPFTQTVPGASVLTTKVKPIAISNFFKPGATSNKITSSQKNNNKTQDCKTKDNQKEKLISKRKKGKFDGVLVMEKGKNKTPVKQKKIPQKSSKENRQQAASISLILFDEVDVVFEEDKGFFAAIQTFMESTKRPMIMTTSNHNFASQFEGRYETLLFKKPAAINLTSYIQSLCLAEGIRTDFNDLKSMVELYEMDVRQTVLLAEFWALSGASVSKVEKKLTAPHSREETNEMGDMPLTPSTKLRKEVLKRMTLNHQSSDNNSDDDFNIVPRRKRRRLIVEESDSSKDGLSPVKRLSSAVPDDNSRPTLEVLLNPSIELSVNEEKAELLDSAEEIPGPPVNVGFFHSVIGLCSVRNSPDDITNILTAVPDNNSTLSQQIDIIKHFRVHGTDLIYANLRQLLGLPTHRTTLSYPPVVKQKMRIKKKYTRIRSRNDIYDSEASDDGCDEFISLKKAVNENETFMNSVQDKLCSAALLCPLTCGSRNCLPESVQSDNPYSETETPVTESKNTVLCSKKQTQVSALCGSIISESVDALAQYYDNQSAFDCYFIKEKSMSEEGFALPGLTDDSRMEESSSLDYSDYISELNACSDMLNLYHARKRLTNVCATTHKLSEDEFAYVDEGLSLPVDEDLSHCVLSQEFLSAKCNTYLIKRCTDNVRSSLPILQSGNLMAINLDYLPYLRQICRTESFRQATKAKRRFFHYLDNIQLHLKQSTTDCLSATFN